ncbi:MAG: hypothetical protein PHI90_08980 [Clostridia bacterium]|nr:hypothetical protein [Clostridia bacterium]MDD4048931.1 hypothetical protein [Clostridia bacterium]
MSIIDIVGYGNNKTEKLCKNKKYAKKELGEKIAEKLESLINFIENATSLNDIAGMPNYHLHDLKRDRKEQFAMDIDGRKSKYRLVVVPDPPLQKNEDKLDFNSKCKVVKCIIILEVSNHYE